MNYDFRIEKVDMQFRLKRELCIEAVQAAFETEANDVRKKLNTTELKHKLKPKINVKWLDIRWLNIVECSSNVFAVVAQQVEHFLGKEEVRRFEPAQQLQLRFKRFLYL